MTAQKARAAAPKATAAPATRAEAPWRALPVQPLAPFFPSTVIPIQVAVSLAEKRGRVVYFLVLISLGWNHLVVKTTVSAKLRAVPTHGEAATAATIVAEQSSPSISMYHLALVMATALVTTAVVTQFLTGK